MTVTKEEGGIPMAEGCRFGGLAFGFPIERAVLAVDVKFAFAGDFVAGELAGIGDDEDLTVALAFYFESDGPILERAVSNFRLAELVRVISREFFAVFFKFEDGFAILSDQGPFPDASGVCISGKSGESRENEGGQEQQEAFHNPIG